MQTTVGPIGRLPIDRGVRVDVGETAVAVFRVGAAVHAFAAACPHLGGPLDEGWVSDGCVECPWHGWRFDLESGISPTNAAMRVEVIPCRVEPDGSVVVDTGS